MKFSVSLCPSPPADSCTKITNEILFSYACKCQVQMPAVASRGRQISFKLELPVAELQSSAKRGKHSSR